MHIVILDGYTENPGDLSWGELEKLGDLTVYDRTSLTDEEEIISRIGGAEVVLTNKTPISRRVMDACPSMRFIAMLATGYNVVDIACAKEKGIPVSNVPVYGTHSVSQFAIALLLEICHHIGYHNDTVKSGKWEQCPDWCYWDYPLIELAGKTYGLLGCGNIGIHTAAMSSPTTCASGTKLCSWGWSTSPWTNCSPGPTFWASKCPCSPSTPASSTGRTSPR